MSDRKALAREIAARTTPRFIEIKKEKSEWRPILGRNEMRNAEKELKRLARLLEGTEAGKEALLPNGEAPQGFSVPDTQET